MDKKRTLRIVDRITVNAIWSEQVVNDVYGREFIPWNFYDQYGVITKALRQLAGNRLKSIKLSYSTGTVFYNGIPSLLAPSSPPYAWSISDIGPYNGTTWSASGGLWVVTSLPIGGFSKVLHAPIVHSENLIKANIAASANIATTATFKMWLIRDDLSEMIELASAAWALTTGQSSKKFQPFNNYPTVYDPAVYNRIGFTWESPTVQATCRLLSSSQINRLFNQDQSEALGGVVLDGLTIITDTMNYPAGEIMETILLTDNLKLRWDGAIRNPNNGYWFDEIVVAATMPVIMEIELE